MKDIFEVFIIIINVFAFVLCAYDKFAAKKGLFRIPEKVLLSGSLLFGSLGMLCGMYLFRHKTKHARFVIAVPVFLAVQTACLLYFGVADINLPLI